MKKTKTYLATKAKADWVKWWNSVPGESEFTQKMTGRIIVPYCLFYMVRYPYGGAPLPKIFYRKRKRK